jgi:hypothetical protein
MKLNEAISIGIKELLLAELFITLRLITSIEALEK